MKKYLGILLLVLCSVSCNSQSKNTTERNVGGPCQDCEALLEYKTYKSTPKSIDTIPGFYDNKLKIKITGTVFQKDNSTPAANVLLYIYQVNSNGKYAPSKKATGWEKIHGQHRTWLRTGKDGKFSFYTFKPASYPGTEEPAHIHIYVKEPNTVPYYLDSYLFESDPLLTAAEKKAEKNRGGSGIVRLTKNNGILTAHRDIVLGLNIPNYN